MQLYPYLVTQILQDMVLFQSAIKTLFSRRQAYSSAKKLMHFSENKATGDPYLIRDIWNTEKIVVNKIKSKPRFSTDIGTHPSGPEVFYQ